MVVCAMLMGVGSVYVIITSTEQLTDIVKGKNVHVALDRINGTIMVLAIVWKALLYAWISKRHSACAVLLEPGRRGRRSGSFQRRPVQFSRGDRRGTSGLKCGLGRGSGGAIAISLYIAYSWLETSIEQVQHLVGRTADPEFLEELREAARPTREDAVRHRASLPLRAATSWSWRWSWSLLRLYACLTVTALDLQQKIEAADGGRCRPRRL